MNKFKVAIALLFCVAMESCATKGDFKVNAHDIEFAKITPASISSAWMQGGKVWLVPKKNTPIEAVFENGQSIPLSPDGAYFSAKPVGKRLTVQVAGNTQPLSFEK